jgi:hypothetical protein
MEGDITWVAPITYDDLTRLLDNPSADRVASVIKRAERGVWPLISQIDTRCLIEFALDDCIRQVGSLSLVGDLVCCCWRRGCRLRWGCVHATATSVGSGVSARSQSRRLDVAGVGRSPTHESTHPSLDPTNKASRGQSVSVCAGVRGNAKRLFRSGRWSVGVARHLREATPHPGRSRRATSSPPMWVRVRGAVSPAGKGADARGDAERRPLAGRE